MMIFVIYYIRSRRKVSHADNNKIGPTTTDMDLKNMNISNDAETSNNLNEDESSEDSDLSSCIVSE